MEKNLKIMLSIFLVLLLYASSSSTISSANVQPVDYFYLTFQWPSSQCNTKQGCCLPKTAKHSRDFIIAGFQPLYWTGYFPTNCDSKSHLDMSKISHLVTRLQLHWPSITCPASDSEKLWSNEWQTYGTCANTLNQHDYFKAALALRKSVNLLKVLSDAGIRPNGSSYEWGTVSDTIVNAGLHLPGLLCNKDKYGKEQLNQVILCSNNNGTKIDECPGLFLGGCPDVFKFPPFNS